jgi:CBS domain-containing protein
MLSAAGMSNYYPSTFTIPTNINAVKCKTVVCTTKVERRMKRCKDVMTKNPIGCLPDDSVVKAAQLMKDKDIGSVLVVEDEETRKLVGIVTDRDLALEIVAEGRDPQVTKVQDVMTYNVVTCRAEDSVQEVMDVMAEYQLRRMPVVDHEDRVVGIIAQADVARHTDPPEKTGEVIRGISQPNMIILER